LIDEGRGGIYEGRGAVVRGSGFFTVWGSEDGQSAGEEMSRGGRARFERRRPGWSFKPLRDRRGSPGL